MIRVKLLLPAKQRAPITKAHIDLEEAHPIPPPPPHPFTTIKHTTNEHVPTMKFSWTAPLLYLAATVTAQATNLTQLPKCAVGCFQQAVVETTSCNPTDTACLCGGDNTVKIEKRASGCVASNCDNAEGEW
jgi:hypothetical protein